MALHRSSPDGHRVAPATPAEESEISAHHHHDHHHQPDLRQKDQQDQQDQQDQKDQNLETQPAETPDDIEHAYLEFSTDLPTPMPGASGSSPVDPPNLTPYMSPFLWSQPRKTLVTIISCCVTALSAYAAGEYTPPSAQLMAKWHVGRVVYNLGITLYTLGFGIGPMVMASFSEINGRRPIFVSSGVVFTVCLVGCGATESFAGMMLARFFLGIAGSTFSTMVGGIISDIYHAQDRNAPMSCFSGAALFGTGLGPLVSGFIEMRVSWRWIFYSQAIAAAVFLVLMLVFLQETRGSVLLSRKARALNRYYEQLEAAGCAGVVFADDDKPRRLRWKVQADEDRETLARMISISCYRPFHLLVTEPVVFFFSLWVAFSWAILYLSFSSVPLVFETNHGFNTQQVGAAFSGVSCPLFEEPLVRSNPLIPPSHLHRRRAGHPAQHLPGKSRRTPGQTVPHPRGAPVLRLRRVHPHARRPVLVRLDVVPVRAVDRARAGAGLCHHGHLLHLPGHLQLPGRYLPPLRQLRHCRPVVLPQHPGRRLSLGRQLYVHQPDLPGGLQSPGGDRTFSLFLRLLSAED